MCNEKDYPFDRSDPQQSQPVSELDADILNLVHSELEAHPGALSRPEIDAAIKKRLDAQLIENIDETGDQRGSSKRSRLFHPIPESVVLPRILNTLENQTAEGKKLRRDLLDREQNFYDGGKWLLTEDDPFFTELEGLCMGLEADMSRLDKESRLRLIYSRTYDFIVRIDRAFPIFGKNTSLYEVVFDACMFMALCMFMQNTNRIESTTLSQYIYNHSRLGFNDKNSMSYIEHEGTWKQGERTEALDSHERTFRQFRHRLFKSRAVDNRRPEWSGMPKPSEYEWQLYSDYVDADGNGDPRLRETLKRIKNLYNDVNKAIDSPHDDEYGKRLENAYEKFLSKLQKIKYEDYLALCKVLLEHIEKERVEAGENWLSSTYYGVNRYRFEKELCLFELTKGVDRLLELKKELKRIENEQKRIENELERIENKQERIANEQKRAKNEQEILANKQKTVEIISDSIFLQNICFPHIRDEFCQYIPAEDVSFFVHKLSQFMDLFIRISRLLVDKFAEDGRLGEDWETLFRETINRMATQIFYTPEDIDYSVKDGAQDEFYLLLKCLTQSHLNNHIELWRCNPQQKSDKK